MGRRSTRCASVTRDGKTMHIRYTSDEARWEFLTPPFKDLGYEASPGFSWKGSRTSRLVPWVPDWVVVLLAIVAVTTIIEVVRWLLGRRKRAEPQAASS